MFSYSLHKVSKFEIKLSILLSGRNAAPKYPLTPAAVFLPPEEGGAKEENVMEAEQVDRIRSNLRETRTVSSSLLKVLMP